MVCPFDYCNTSAVYLNIDDPDTQCTLNRSGILCGQCQAGLSLMLGSNRCQSCSNKYLVLIAGFMLIGMALVAFLLVCNLTVSMGSINGVLFYSNIFKLNEVVFFPDGVKMPVLSHFISWFNLDLGIEICFFHGLDGYWKTWLQYVFPIYIWLLVGAIIIGSHYSGRLSRVFGNNTVPVLATLILMSYSKLLRTITNALMVSMIKCDKKEWSLWSVDANIAYLSHKHLYLVVGSLLFLFVSTFYGGMIFSAQWLQRCTGKYCKASRDPVVKLKPLVDSYTGPYKDKYRFWTGLLIFVRVILTAVFSYTTQTLPGINNYIIIVVCVLLIRVSANGIYRNKALNYLEFSHYFNLFCVSLSSELFYHLQWNSHKIYLSSASISISMILFIGTVLVHIHIKLEKKLGKILCFKFRSATDGNNSLLQEAGDMNNSEDEAGSPAHIIQRRDSIIFDFNRQ
uniref:TRP C-terminal domain-containing protein n=1 Tax=Amphimedon queenslandica TaxID=400682 RepID=A0A1X7TU31_AMPQE